MEDPARIKANIAKMVAGNASDDEIDDYILSEEEADRVSAATAGRQEEYKSGRLLRRHEAENAVDAAEAESSTFGSRFGGALATGVGMVGPGATAALTGLRSVVRRQPFSESLADIKTAKASAPGVAKVLAGGAGVAASIPFVPLRLLQAGRGAGAVGGGVLSGANRLLSPESESAGSRALGTVTSTALGAGIGAAAPWAMGHAIPRTVLGSLGGGAVGAAAAPEHPFTGFATGAVAGGTALASPSATAGLVSRVAGKVGATKLAGLAQNVRQATGLRGQVNAELEGTDRLVKPFGGMVGATGPGAEQKIAEAARLRAQSARLYGAARADRQILDDPETMALVNDPDLAGGFRAVARIRAEAGDALPERIVPPKGAPRMPGMEPTSLAPVEDVVETLPDPEAIHLLKRIVQEAQDKSFEGQRVIPYEDAIRIEPKLTALRDLLHARSPAYRAADNAFQVGAAGQEAFDEAASAATGGMRNPTPRKLGVADVAGVRASAGRARSADAEQAARVTAAVRRNQGAGARSQIAQQIAKQGTGGGRQEALRAPALAMSGPAREQRALALGPKAPAYEKTLADVREQATSDAPGPLFLPWKVHAALSLAGVGRRPLEGAAASRLLAAPVDDPFAYQDVLARFGSGKKAMTLLERISQVLGPSAAGVGR